jgi:hypothetical protein
MGLLVDVFPKGRDAFRASGPADIGGLGAGTVLVLDGSPNFERDFGKWANALGLAAMNGAEVRHRG